MVTNIEFWKSSTLKWKRKMTLNHVTIQPEVTISFPTPIKNTFSYDFKMENKCYESLEVVLIILLETNFASTVKWIYAD